MFILAFEFSKIDFFPSFSWQKRFHKYRGCVKDTFEKVKNNYYYIISRIRYETPCIIYSGMAISQLYFLYYLSIQASTICQDMKQCLFEKSKSKIFQCCYTDFSSKFYYGNEAQNLCAQCIVPSI